jgi:hypothetical protein
MGAHVRHFLVGGEVTLDHDDKVNVLLGMHDGLFPGHDVVGIIGVVTIKIFVGRYYLMKRSFLVVREWACRS